MSTEEIGTQLRIHLHRMGRWWRLVEGARLATWGLSGGLAAALALALLSRLVPVAPASVMVPVCLGLVLVGGVVGLAIAWYRPRPLLLVARLVDRRIGLRARLATAWAIASGVLPVTPEQRVVPDQLADALHTAEQIDPRLAFPLRVSRLGGAVVLALVLALAAALLLPNPQEAVLAHRAAVRQSVDEQVAELEKLQAELIELGELAETETGRQVLDELEALKQALAEGELSQEEAVAALSETETRLRRLQDESSAARQAAMREAGRRVEQTGETGLNQALAEALARGDADVAAGMLADLADEEGEALSREEELALADALEQAAGALTASDPELAESLAQAAQAIRHRDVTAARESLAAASRQMSQAGQEIEAQQAAGRAADRLQQGRQAVAGAGQSGQDGQAAQSGQSSQEGQGGQGQQESGQGGQSGQGQQGGGQGAGDTGGQGAAGAGSGSGDPGQAGEGGMAGGQMPTDNSPGQGLERIYEPVYAPQLLGGEGGEEVGLLGTGDPGEDALPLPGHRAEPGEARVPYNAVYTTYRDAAAEALEGSFIPPGMKEIVRQYFSSLEP